MQIDSTDWRTPQAVRSELGRFGGLNQYGRAHWRVVLAEDRLVLRGGVFKHMPTGNVKTIEVDPKTFRIYVNEVKPDRIVTGYHRVPKYPVKGWIIERWFPAHTFGSPAQWESAKSSDGVTPMMGPFPHEGDYFMLAGPFDRIPEMADLKTAISMHIRAEEEQPVSYKQMLLNEINADLEAKEKQWKAYEDQVGAFYQQEVDPILKGTSLAAGRIRNELAEAMGDRSHQGIA